MPATQGSWQPSTAPILESPAGISPCHWRELTEGSGIRPDVAELNFASFGADTPLHWEEQRRELLQQQRLAIATTSTTAKGLAQHQAGHVSSKLLKLDQRYKHFQKGGWRFIGAALPGFEATPRWKPNQPRTDARGRFVKYEAAPGRRPGLLLPRVPAEVAATIASRNSLAPPAAGESFWQWALDNPCLPLAVVEGEKKACALLSVGIAAVGIAGIELGRVVKRNAAGQRISEALVDELVALVPDRQITIAFDADPKPSTRRRVRRAATRLGHAMQRAGASVAIAHLPLLNGDKCGPDDLLVAGGGDALLLAISNATALDQLAWHQRRLAERHINATVELEDASIPKALALPAAAVVGVRAPKGGGKTNAVARWLADTPKVLSITHRRTLGAAMAARLGLVWRNETDSAGGRHWDADGNCWQGIPPRYSLCIDSLLAVPPAAFAGGVIVLDEAEQVLQHLLMSTTCRDKRGLILQRFKQIISNAAQVLALDADLSDATMLWLADGKEEDICLIEAAGKTESPWPVHWYEQQRPEEAQAALLKAAAAAPVFVTTDSREKASALHELLQQHLPGATGLLITSETTEKEETRNWLGKLTSLEALAAGGIRWVVASPSISSGLSIEHCHFRSVFGFYGAGTFDDGEAVQALARVRQAVPRHIWVGSVVKPAAPPLSRAWWPQQVENDLRQRWNNQAAMLRQQLQPDLLLEPCAAEAAEAAAAAATLWADFQSRRNYSLDHLRGFIKARLIEEGHRLTAVKDALSGAEIEELKEVKSELQEQRRERHAKQIAGAPTISTAEAASMKRHQPHHPALQRHRLLQRLALPADQLTPELVTWGEQWAGAAERLMLLFNPERAIAKDLDRLVATTNQGDAPLAFDQSFKAQHSKAADVIGLKEFITSTVFAGKTWSNATPEVKALAAAARHHHQQLEQVLGIKARKNDSDSAVVAGLLRHFGITTALVRKTATTREYGADAEQLELIKNTADRLRHKEADAVAPSAAGVNQTTSGATKSSAPEAADEHQQLPLELGHPEQAGARAVTGAHVNNGHRSGSVKSHLTGISRHW